MHTDSTAVLLAIAMLTGAMVSDLRTRRVGNRYWLPFLAGAALLTGRDLLAHPEEWLAVALAVGVCGLFYLLWRFRAYGGADAKGLMVLSILLPVPVSSPATIPALDVLMDGLLVAMLLPVSFLLWNLVHGRFAFPAVLLGFPMGGSRAQRHRVWPLQRVDAAGRLRWAFRRPFEDPWPALASAGVQRVWVTPQVPFMVFLLAGLCIDLVWGDLVARWALAMAG